MVGSAGGQEKSIHDIPEICTGPRGVLEVLSSLVTSVSPTLSSKPPWFLCRFLVCHEKTPLRHQLTLLRCSPSPEIKIVLWDLRESILLVSYGPDMVLCQTGRKGDACVPPLLIVIKLKRSRLDSSGCVKDLARPATYHSQG